jgi:hypothetical protein
MISPMGRLLGSGAITLITLMALAVGVVTAGPQVGHKAAGAAAPESADSTRPYTPPARQAAWIPSPGAWETLDRQRVDTRDGSHWLIESARRRLGEITGGRGPVEIDLPRIAFNRIAAGETTRVAVLLPDGNRDLILRPPGSAEESAVPSEPTEDAYGRWPNACGLLVLDGSGRLDLDDDGAPEIAVRRWCSCPSLPCEGIEFIELETAGPVFLDLPGIIRNVEVGTVVVQGMERGRDAARPTLRLAPDMLDGCRVIAVAGVRGTSECADCCRFPVLVRPNGAGYEVFYDSKVQKTQLQRAQKDIGYVAVGTGPLRSAEEAQIARAASFYYLTGLGSRTPGLILEGLGARGNDPGVRGLLDRLDAVFLDGVQERD